MDSTPTSPQDPAEENSEKSEENQIDRARIAALVTPEQVHSASVAKKRRTFTKRRSATKKRDQTPIKDLSDNDKTTSEEECSEAKPKTPERRRRRFKRTNDEVIVSKSEPEITDHDHNNFKKRNKSDGIKTSNSFPKQTLISDFAQGAQEEITHFFNKTKKSLQAAANRGRDRFKKVDKACVKRSQSAPHAFTEEELIESFKKAQLLNFTNDNKLLLELPNRKYSDSSLMSNVSTANDTKESPKSFRPEVQEFVRQRKKQRQINSHKNEKIVEILDPKTSKIISRKSLVKPIEFNLKHVFQVLRFCTIKELRNNYRLFKLQNREECAKIRRLRNRCFCELFLVMIFCGLGGILFKFIEGSFEHFYKCGVKRVKRDFIELLWTKSHNLREEDWKSLARNKLRTFEEELHTAHEAGMKTYSGQRSWSFLNAVVYCLSIVTTIGYGHIYPETRTGKALTIVYAIIGIPLFLIALTDFGKLFTRCIKFLWSFVRRVYYTGNCRQVRKTAHVKEIFKGAQMMYEIATFRRPSMFVDPENPQPTDPSSESPIGDDTPTTPAISNFEIDDEFNLPISVAIFILVVYILCGGLIYCLWENWDFFDSFYFVFISMSTVGFGDMVPDDAACMIVSIVYLVFGLALTSMCINVVQVKLSDTFKQASSKIGATIGISVAEEDGSILTVPPDDVDVVMVHDAAGKSPGSPRDENLLKPDDNKKES